MVLAKSLLLVGKVVLQNERDAAGVHRDRERGFVPGRARRVLVVPVRTTLPYECEAEVSRALRQLGDAVGGGVASSSAGVGGRGMASSPATREAVVRHALRRLERVHSDSIKINGTLESCRGTYTIAGEWAKQGHFPV